MTMPNMWEAQFRMEVDRMRATMVNHVFMPKELLDKVLEEAIIKGVNRFKGELENMVIQECRRQVQSEIRTRVQSLLDDGTLKKAISKMVDAGIKEAIEGL